MSRIRYCALALTLAAHIAWAAPNAQDEPLAWLSNFLIEDLASPAEAVGNSRGLMRGMNTLVIGPTGAARDAFVTAGRSDEALAADILLARAWWLDGETDRARTLARDALARAEAAGWQDARANGLLRDLALYTAGQDDALAATYRQRAAACPDPCEQDAVAALIAEAAAAAQRPGTLDATRFEAAQVRFVEQAYGRKDPFYASILRSAAAALADERPWLAIDYQQRHIEASLAQGTGEADLYPQRLALARLLLRAGEYARLAGYSDQMLERFRALSPEEQDQAADLLAQTHRIRARGRRQIAAPDTRRAYEEAVEQLFQIGGRDRAMALLLDLLDTDALDLARRVGEAIHQTPDWQTYSALARIAAREGRYSEAAALTETLLARLEGGDEASLIDAWAGHLPRENILVISDETRQQAQTLLAHAFRLQLGAYLEAAGETERAASLRREIPLPSPDALRDGLGVVGSLTEVRDLGAFDAAGFLALGLLDAARGWEKHASYYGAQRLWQLAYSLARAGRHAEAFPLMQRAAKIASELSYAQIEDSDGGSLELMKRDKWRYLLFVDIAWAASSGERPQDMTVLSRY